MRYTLTTSLARRLGLCALVSVTTTLALGHVYAAASPGQGQGANAAERAAGGEVIDRYCVTCHNERLRTGGLALDHVDFGNLGANAEIWEKIVRKLRTGAMPPMGVPRPPQASVDSFVARLETVLDREATANLNVGHSAVRRLNRREYANAIRDIVALEIDGDALLPADDSGYGFDNISDLLSVSPALLDSYLTAARKVSRLAVGDATLTAGSEIHILTDVTNDVGERVEDVRMSEDLPFGTSGGGAVRHYFPLDGEYVVKVRLQRTFFGYIRGLRDAHQLDLRLDGARLQLFDIPAAPQGGRGTRQAGFATGGGDPEWEKYVREGADAHLEKRIAVRAGVHTIGVSFGEVDVEPAEVLKPRITGWGFAILESTTNPQVNSVTVSGPFDAVGPGDTPSRRRIFVCRPVRVGDEEACARKILANLARRAYRRPASDSELQVLVDFYRKGRRDGSFDTGVEWALERLFISPAFLFRLEGNSVGEARAAFRVSDLELASRLSFFLWSSVPDEVLMDVAMQGRLKDPVVLEQQVRRMLADPRASTLVTNFADQWLQLRRIQAVLPDGYGFPQWDELLRRAFQEETHHFIESAIREDRSVVDLLRANYTFLNERLAKHYGIPGVYGSQFRRVALPANSARAGLLGQGSILTLTSYQTRTAPTIRGKWVLENLLGSPPPPPPPNVPVLKESDDDGKPKSMRAAMEQHRQNPACASCHARMDPIGFALENFDAIGRWRTKAEDGSLIDPSGKLPDGTSFAGMAELRDALLRRPEQFVTTVTEKLLTYALGRGVEYYDQPAIRTIVRDASRHEYRWSTIILGVVNSAPFQMRQTAADRDLAAGQVPVQDGPSARTAVATRRE